MKNIPAIIIILCISLFCRAYTISAGLPYFYDEDEAHHFNRVVNMAKSGDMNPHYFHKPSLHFYLRIPVVWLSAYWAKSKGHIENIEDIRTHNKYGIADYAFTASHQGVVKWNRAFSVILSLLIVVFTYLTALILTKSALISFAAALITAVSPPLIAYAATIGVDTLMSLMCLISVFFSVLYHHKPRTINLLAACIFAGLAISSKYNALPIVAAPLFSCFFSNKLSKKSFLTCSFLPLFVFFLTSPYILISLPTFIQDISYEIWHYSVAGHEGHDQARGFPQVIFYSKWILNEALGYCLACLAAAGLIFALFSRIKAQLIFLSFPLLYFLMMILQKANFTRNMLVIIPFLSILAAIALFKFINLVNLPRRTSSIIFLLILSISIFQPLNISLKEKGAWSEIEESRSILTEWIFANNDLKIETALAGQLQADPRIPTSLQNVTTVDQETSTPDSLLIQGYDRIIISKAHDPAKYSASPFLEKFIEFQGSGELQRIIKNPAIEVYNVMLQEIDNRRLSDTLKVCKHCKLNLLQNESVYSCDPNSLKPGEDYCWLKNRFNLITIPGLSDRLSEKGTAEIIIKIMSPWDHNRIGFSLQEKNKEILLAKGGEWNEYKVSISQSDLIEKDTIFIAVEKVLSPAKLRLGKDQRRLGLGFKTMQIY